MASNIELSQAIVTVAMAVNIASRFPGIMIDASPTDEWGFSITHSVDHAFDCHNVALDELVAWVKTVKAELEGRYGPGGARLDDAILPELRINSHPTK